MPLETGTIISDLNASNPAHSDGLSQADAHMRLIKACLLATFPNINDELAVTDEQLNELAVGILSLANGSAGTPSLYFGSDTDNGIYRHAADILGISKGLTVNGAVALLSTLAVTGRISGNGAKEVGEYCQFAKLPSSLASGGTAVGTERFVLPDGSTYNIATFPALGAFLGSTYGGNGVTTFAVPDLITGNKFLRAAGGSLAVGTSQADAIKSHDAAVTGTIENHTHGWGASTDVTPTLANGGAPLSNTPTGATVGAPQVGFGIYQTSFNPINVSLSGNTGFQSDSDVTGTAAYTGATETRPANVAAYIVIKT